MFIGKRNVSNDHKLHMRSKHTTAGKRDVEKLIQPGGV